MASPYRSLFPTDTPPNSSVITCETGPGDMPFASLQTTDASNRTRVLTAIQGPPNGVIDLEEKGYGPNGEIDRGALQYPDGKVDRGGDFGAIRDPVTMERIHHINDPVGIDMAQRATLAEQVCNATKPGGPKFKILPIAKPTGP
jgi:hypothetical protein